MPLFSSSQPSLRARVLPRFPAQVIAGTGMSIAKSGGVYTFAVDVGQIPPTSLGDIPTSKLIGRDDPDGLPGPPGLISCINGLTFMAAEAIGLTENQRLRSLQTRLYNGGSVLATGVAADILCPFQATIWKVTLMANPSGSCVVDIWKKNFSTSFPPVVGDSITASAKPTLSAAAGYQDTTLTGWTTSVFTNDVLRININSLSTITRLDICIDLEGNV